MLELKLDLHFCLAHVRDGRAQEQWIADVDRLVEVCGQLLECHTPGRIVAEVQRREEQHRQHSMHEDAAIHGAPRVFGIGVERAVIARQRDEVRHALPSGAAWNLHFASGGEQVRRDHCAQEIHDGRLRKIRGRVPAEDVFTFGSEARAPPEIETRFVLRRGQKFRV